jgi:hypothetical protein
VAVTENTELGNAGFVVDRVVPPLAGCDSAAVQRKQLIEFGAGKKEMTVVKASFG